MPGGAAEFFDAMPQRVQRLRQQVRAESSRFLVLFRLEEMADLRARLAGLDETKPVRVGRGIRCSENFDAVTVAQFGTQRQVFVIDLARDAAVADIGMYGIGEVDSCRATRQREDFPFRRKDIDLAGKQIDLDVFQELGRIDRGSLQFEQ